MSEQRQITPDEWRLIEADRARRAAMERAWQDSKGVTFPQEAKTSSFMREVKPHPQFIDPMINLVVIAWLRDVREEMLGPPGLVDFPAVTQAINRRIAALVPDSPEAKVWDGDQAKSTSRSTE